MKSFLSVVLMYFMVSAEANPKALMDAGRLLVFFKGNDSHDYKYSAALMEDYGHVSPEWRNRYLASGMMQLRGSGRIYRDLVPLTSTAYLRTFAKLSGNRSSSVSERRREDSTSPPAPAITLST